jgi:hypothetical protein
MDVVESRDPVDPSLAFNDLRPYLLIYAFITGGAVPGLWLLGGILRVVGLTLYGAFSVALLLMLIRHLKRTRWSNGTG